jgi:adenylate kinase
MARAALRKSAVASAALLSGRSPRHGGKRSSIERSYSAAAMALCVEEEAELGSWELPLPVLQDVTSGQKTGRGPQWVFLGSPGVGKSTYAARLAKLLNVPHISMGSLLHNEASKSTTFGKEVRFSLP